MTDPAAISFTTEQIIAGAGIMVAAILGLSGFIAYLIGHILKGPQQQLGLLRAHISTLERSQVDSKNTIQSISERATGLEARSFTFLETMSARQAMMAERMAGLSQHTVNVLDEICDSLHRMHATDTSVHVVVKGEIDKARGHAKYMSGEHRP